MLCLSGFELYSRWVPLVIGVYIPKMNAEIFCIIFPLKAYCDLFASLLESYLK